MPTMPDPKTFDRARLTPEGFVRDPKGDVLIIPDGVLTDDVPEWAAFVRESLLPHTRATIRAGLKGGYSVYTMFDKDGGWWDTHQITPAGTAPSIRLARFHAFQALAQRVLEADPTNEDAAGTLVLAGRAIDRGDRPATFAEYMTDLCLMTAAMNTAEAAKPPAEKAPEVAPWTPGDTRLFDRWFAGSPNLGIVAYKDSGEFKNLSAYAYADKWGVYVGNDVPNIEGNEGSYEKNLIAAEKAYQRQLPRRHTAVLVSGGGNIEAQIVQVGGKRPVGEWYAWIHDTSRRFKVYSDNADELYARADRDGWWVISDHKTLAKGNAGGLESNTRAAERLYARYAADKDAEKKAAQAPPEPKPPEVLTIGIDEDGRPVGRWYQRGGPGGLSWIFEKTPGEGFSADVSNMSWFVRENDAVVVRGCEGSYEKNLIAADKAYRNLLAAKAAKAPTVRRVTNPSRHPVNEWYSRQDAFASRYEFGCPAFEAKRGLGVDVSRALWTLLDDGKTIASGDEGSYEKNLIAADKAYRDLLAAKTARVPAPPPTPTKDQYRVLPSTVDVYTTPTHIAIGQVWRDTYGATAMVSSVTTFEDNYAADTNGEVLNLEYDKDGRITNYGGCTYVGYVPVVWLDKVPSGG